jgi:probable HAF family extracellular repeat protein
MNRVTRAVAVSLCFAAVLTQVPSQSRAANAKYTVTDIGTLVGTGDGQFDSLVSSNPIAINEQGEVAGDALTVTQPSWSVVFTSSNGKIHRIGKESQYSFAFDLSDSGDIAGFVKGKDDTTFTHETPVVGRDRKLVKLPTLGGDNGNAFGFGPNGDIVGMSTSAKGDGAESHATLWHKDKATDLGTLGGQNSLAYGMNADGVIVGWANLPSGDGEIPCLWRHGKAEQLPLSDGMTSGFVARINASGEMTGTELDAANAYYAVHWVDGQAERLPGLFDGAIGSAGGITAAGVIVGTTSSGPDNSAPLVGAMWVKGKLSIVQDLIPSDTGYQIGTAAGINEAGQIAAAATTADGARHGVVLNPVDQSAAKVTAVNGKESGSGDLTRQEFSRPDPIVGRMTPSVRGTRDPLHAESHPRGFLSIPRRAEQ